MSQFYDETVAVVKTAIAEYGRMTSFYSPQDVSGAQPWKNQQLSSLLTTVPAVFVPASGDSLGEDIVSEEMLRRVSEVCLVAPDDAADLRDCTEIKDRSVTYAVEWVSVLQPGDTVLLYIFGVKR